MCCLHEGRFLPVLGHKMNGLYFFSHHTPKTQNTKQKNIRIFKTKHSIDYAAVSSFFVERNWLLSPTSRAVFTTLVNNKKKPQWKKLKKLKNYWGATAPAAPFDVNFFCFVLFLRDKFRCFYHFLWAFWLKRKCTFHGYIYIY